MPYYLQRCYPVQDYLLYSDHNRDSQSLCVCILYDFFLEIPFRARAPGVLYRTLRNSNRQSTV